MTEEQAKTKWCPYSGLVNSPGEHLQISRCIGSGCMMWRWQIPKNVRISDSDTGANREGCCGLAGKP